MSVGLAAAVLAVLLSLYFGFRWGMWRAVGGGFHASAGPPSLAFAILVLMAAGLESAGIAVFRESFQSTFRIPLYPFIVAVIVPASLLFLYRWTGCHTLLLAVFDRLLDGTSVRRSYRRRAAGHAFERLLRARRLGTYR
ncbi:MAG: hypothetical protein SVW02_01780 [Candidatus Nanohaloarchaea archaeon]|nr:hypothetical protein [Candidatus Nanohaloarchaea archaeon]